MLAVLAAIVLAGRYLMQPLFRWVAGTGIREIFVAFALLIVVGITLLMDEIGLSAALAKEYSFDELRVTTIDADHRTLLRISVEQAAIADEVMSVLMGDDVESRKNFIQQNASDVRFLDI